MNPKIANLVPRWWWVVAGLTLSVVSATAQQHRATRLGDPAHRFAKPLQTPEDLRRLFADPSMKADMAAILNQAGWKGDVDDLRRAAAKEPIVAVKLPRGSRLPFMSSRNNGRPVTLIDVLWDGKEPINAYQFEFVSKRWRYRCVTPKACANFFVVDLGPVRAVEVVRRTPASVSLCDPFEVVFEVRNVGGATLTDVRVAETVPTCWKALDSRTEMVFEAGTLRPDEGRVFGYRAQAQATGPCVGEVRATSAEGATARAQSTVVARMPVLALDCWASGEVLAGRPIEVCVTVKNSGDAAEPGGLVALAIPLGTVVAGIRDGGVSQEGAVVWNLTALPPGATKTVCATFTAAQPGPVEFRVGAKGDCALPVESRCSTVVAGIPAILLEVVDVEDPIEVGNQVTYEIRVTNQGSSVGTNLKWVCTLPEGQEFVSGGGPTAVQGEGRTGRAEPLAAIEPKAEVVWRVVVKATAEADARFKVDLTSDQFQRPVEEWEATSQY